MQLKLKDVEKQIRKSFDHFGLKEFAVGCVIDSTEEPTISIALTKKLKLDPKLAPEKAVEKALDEVEIRITDSDCAWAAVVKAVKELDEMIENCSKLQTEVKDLEKYAVYYDMHYKMKHGS